MGLLNAMEGCGGNSCDLDLTESRWEW